MNDGVPRWLNRLRLSVSALGSGHDPGVLGLSPASGSLLSLEPASPSALRSAHGLARSLALSLSLPLFLSHQ